jgi:hypothetical protein
MKKIITFLLSVLLFLNVYSQSEYKTTIINTSYASTSKMVWNYSLKKWDFISNNDNIEYETTWVFRTTSSNEGMITNGSVNYDILKYKYVNDSTIYLKVWNVKVAKEMEMVVIKNDELFNIAIFDNNARTSYYFTNE